MPTVGLLEMGMYLMWLNSLIFSEDRFHESCCLSFRVLMGQWVILPYQNWISQRKTMGDLRCTQRLSNVLATCYYVQYGSQSSGINSPRSLLEIPQLGPSQTCWIWVSVSTGVRVIPMTFNADIQHTCFIIILNNRDGTINKLADSQQSLQEHFGRNPKQAMMAYWT